MHRKKARNVKRLPKCTYCHRLGHRAMNCWDKPNKPIEQNRIPQWKSRKPMKKESTESRKKRQYTGAIWFRDNPSADGYWLCYLQISRQCLRRVDRDQITLEHVYPKNKYPALKFEPLNIKASCAFCNDAKKSNTIRQLALVYENIREMVKTPEWQAWEDQMESLAQEKGIRLDRPILAA